MMTFKERLQIEHPEKVEANYFGGCLGCPAEYRYSEVDYSNCGKIVSDYNCGECWNQEIPADSFQFGDTVRIKEGFIKGKYYDNVCFDAIDGYQGNMRIVGKIINGNYLVQFDTGLILEYAPMMLEKIKAEERKEDMETKKFTRDDLKDLMLIEVRCGKRYLWINGKPIQIKGFVGYINDDLKNEYNEDYDIVKVGYPNKKADTIEEMLKMDFSEIIWEREPASKDVSLEEINTLLKEKYPDVDVFNLPIKDGETK